MNPRFIYSSLLILVLAGLFGIPYFFENSGRQIASSSPSRLSHEKQLAQKIRTSSAVQLPTHDPDKRDQLFFGHLKGAYELQKRKNRVRLIRRTQPGVVIETPDLFVEKWKAELGLKADSEYHIKSKTDKKNHLRSLTIIEQPR